MTKDSSPPRLSQDEHTVGMRGVVFLVKTGQVGTGGTIDYKNFALGTLLINGRISSIVIPRNVIHVDSRDSTNINRWTCTTPDIDVVMGSFKTTDFPRAGSLSPGAGASVPIRFLNCPALGAGHTIQYRIDPVSGTVGRNVAALTGGSSTAKGLGILLFDAYGAVFPLSQNQRLKEFNSGVGGSYTVPLTARYYATGAVTAGQANSSMTLTVSYQ
ncbi:fimbrial protein [Burkholderia cenocepacia]|uniref:fimbrial protein n=1 Tax=Burkholderia cenocepacia TaxID=95486 RepID=UPI002AC33671|nr:fimbrial protein [Burkholderia cenocepacia]